MLRVASLVPGSSEQSSISSSGVADGEAFCEKENHPPTPSIHFFPPSIHLSLINSESVLFTGTVFLVVYYLSPATAALLSFLTRRRLH